MTFNTSSIAEKIREDVECLIALTSGNSDEKLSAYEIEDKLWWSLLALGFQLLSLFFGFFRNSRDNRLISYANCR